MHYKAITAIKIRPNGGNIKKGDIFLICYSGGENSLAMI
jgi:hypothetical protein